MAPAPAQQPQGAQLRPRQPPAGRGVQVHAATVVTTRPEASTPLFTATAAPSAAAVPVTVAVDVPAVAVTISTSGYPSSGTAALQGMMGKGDGFSRRGRQQ